MAEETTTPEAKPTKDKAEAKPAAEVRPDDSKGKDTPTGAAEGTASAPKKKKGRRNVPRGIVRRICEKCKIIKRHGVVRVICPNPRHKQRQR